MMNMPVYAALITILIGVLPPLKALFFASDGTAEPIGSTLVTALVSEILFGSVVVMLLPVCTGHVRGCLRPVYSARTRW